MRRRQPVKHYEFYSTIHFEGNCRVSKKDRYRNAVDHPSAVSLIPEWVGMRFNPDRNLIHWISCCFPPEFGHGYR